MTDRDLLLSSRMAGLRISHPNGRKLLRAYYCSQSKRLLCYLLHRKHSGSVIGLASILGIRHKGTVIGPVVMGPVGEGF